MNNIKQAKPVKPAFMFLAICLSMLLSPSINEAQDNSTNCQWVQRMVLKPKYNGITNTLDWVLEPDSICVPITSRTKSAASSGESNVTSSSFSVSSNNALLGAWKYFEYSGGIDSGGIRIPPSFTGATTFTFNQSGVLHKTKSAVYGGISYTQDLGKPNWRYVPQTDSTGVLEQYEGNKLVYKNNVRWIDNDQFEISASDTGKGLLFKRQGNNPNNYKSLNESVSVPSTVPLSSSLSMAERLPMQLGQFKREALSYNCINPNKEIGNSNSVPVGDPAFASSAPPKTPSPIVCKRDEIEIAVGGYNGLGHIFIFKYENSSKAAQAMAVEINNNSSDIIKRESVKNRAGQTVGELIVLQSAQYEGEVVRLIFSEYLYAIVATRRGDAQNALKFLPLK